MKLLRTRPAKKGIRKLIIYDTKDSAISSCITYKYTLIYSIVYYRFMIKVYIKQSQMPYILFFASN